MHNLKKRLLSVLCSGAMIGTSLTAAVPYNSLIVRAEDNGVQQVIHVEVNGNDKTGDGSQEKPFATLARAQKAVREINGNMTGDIIVSVGAGDYYLDEAIQMDERDSGSNGFEVIWQGSNKSADDVSTRLIGGQDITGEGYQWKAATAEDEASGLLPGMAGKVYKIQLNPEDYQYFDYTNSDYMDDEDYPQGYYGHQGFNELYVNGEKAIMARSQNYRHYEDFENQRGDYWYAGGKTGGKSDSIYYKAGGGKAGPSASDVKGMADAQERGDRVIAQLVIWDAGDNDWVSNTIPIEKIDEGSRKLTAVQSPTTSLYPYNYQIPGTSTPLPKQGGRDYTERSISCRAEKDIFFRET